MLVQQQNPTLLVLLLGVIIAGVCAAAIFLSQTEVFNPELAQQWIHSSATFDGLAFQATQNAQAATASVLDATQSHDQMIAEATQMPMQQTLQSAHIQATQIALEAQTTSTAIAAEQQYNLWQGGATQTAAFVQNEALLAENINKQETLQTERVAYLIIAAAIGILTLVTSGGVLVLVREKANEIASRTTHTTQTPIKNQPLQPRMTIASSRTRTPLYNSEAMSTEKRKNGKDLPLAGD